MFVAIYTVHSGNHGYRVWFLVMGKTLTLNKTANINRNSNRMTNSHDMHLVCED